MTILRWGGHVARGTRGHRNRLLLLEEDFNSAPLVLRRIPECLLHCIDVEPHGINLALLKRQWCCRAGRGRWGRIGRGRFRQPGENDRWGGDNIAVISLMHIYMRMGRSW